MTPGDPSHSRGNQNVGTVSVLPSTSHSRMACSVTSTRRAAGPTGGLQVRRSTTGTSSPSVGQRITASPSTSIWVFRSSPASLVAGTSRAER